MNITKEIKKQVAIERMEKLTEKFKLDSRILNALKKDIVYCSYSGCIPCDIIADHLKNNKVYQTIVKNFEKENDCLVYHVITDNITLSLLYVSDNKKLLGQSPVLYGKRLWAYVYNIEEPEFSENGYIDVCAVNGLFKRIYP